MLIRNDQNPETFLDSICRHLAPGNKWEFEKGEKVVSFGHGFWKGELIFKVEGSSSYLFGVNIVCEDYENSEIDVVEDAISILEGLGYRDEDAILVDKDRD